MKKLLCMMTASIIAFAMGATVFAEASGDLLSIDSDKIQKYGEYFESERYITVPKEGLERPKFLNSRTKTILFKEGDDINKIIRSIPVNFISRFEIIDTTKALTIDVLQNIFGKNISYPVGYGGNGYEFKIYTFNDVIVIKGILHFTEKEDEQEKMIQFAKNWAKKNIGKTDSDFLKMKKIHSFLVSEYNYRGADEIDGSLASNRRYSAYAFLESKKGVCSSFVGMFNMLAKEAGLESEDVLGYFQKKDKKSEYHAWNRVKIGKEWWHIDATIDEFEYERAKAVGGNTYFMYKLPDFELKNRKSIYPVKIFPTTNLPKY